MPLPSAVHDLLENFVRAEYPDCDALLLFGSHARREATVESDIDAFVILRNLARCYQQTRVHAGATLDLHIYDCKGLAVALEVQRRTHMVHFAISLVTGHVLWDHSRALERLRRSAQCILDAPRPPPDWTSLRASITALLPPIRRPRSDAQRIACLNALYQLVSKVLLLRGRGWLAGPKELAAILHSLDSAMCQRLHQTYEQAIAGECLGFETLIMEVLVNIGGPILLDAKRYVT